jgi:GGDEF domain-containing protein
MSAEPTRAGRQMSYAQARALLIAGGLAVLGLVALIMYLRRVETVEVVAVLLFVPVFLAFVTWDVVGGLVSAVVASGIYLALRRSAIQAVGASTFTGLIASRVVGLVVFGVVGGWANGLLRASLTKLDLYDQIDDDTGLFNARYFVLQADLEKARSDRYKTFFSVAVIDVPVAWLDRLGRRQQRKLLRDLGRVLHDSIRTIDRAVHCVNDDAHRIAVIMPETGPEGARIFADRLSTSLLRWLGDNGASAVGPLDASTATIPPDEATLATLREQFAAIVELEHPRTAAFAPGP